jgi:multicomponent Na+:H+ antiporter subunit C
MSAGLLYAATGALLFCGGLFGFLLHAHLVRKILALNVTGSGVFLALVGLAQRIPERAPDPVPHALVLTGIVIAVSATALALLLVRRLYATTGASTLQDDARR